MYVPTLNLKIQVSPAFVPLNKKKKFTKESVILNLDSKLFKLHLERIQLPKRLLTALPEILFPNESSTPKPPHEIVDGKILKCLGTFSVGAIPLSWRQSTIFAAISDPSAKDVIKSSSKFSQLLNLLVEINQNLIIDLNGELAILQPMSCSLATLTCLKEAFYKPAIKFFEDGNVYHLSKKIVATLLDEVMMLKNSASTLQKDEGSEMTSSEAGDLQSETSSVDISIKMANISTKAGKNKNFAGVNGKVFAGQKKRQLEEPEMASSPKRVKRSNESPAKKMRVTSMPASQPQPSKMTRTRSAASWRSQLILEKSMEMRRKSFIADDDGSSCHSISQGDSFGGRGSAAAPSSDRGDELVLAAVAELKDETNLSKFLHELYEKVIEVDAAMLSTARNIVKATVQYFTQQMNPQESQSNNGLILEASYNYLSEKILMTNTTIRNKYKGKDDVEFEDKKLKELQLQSLLFCEVDTECSSIKSCCDTLEQRHEEVVSMLRTMSFMKDTGLMTMFLNTSMLENYHKSSPRFLYRIYDSLLHPLPTQLEYLMSPDKLEDDFFPSPPINQDQSIASLITNPRVETNELELDQLLEMEKQTRMSNKNQRSLSFTQAPRMKIELPAKKTLTIQQRRSERIASTSKSQDDHRAKVRRSLFNDNKSPEPSPSKKNHTPAKSMPAHYVLKTKQVKETPVNRQGINRYLKRQEKLMQSLDTSDVWCVDETPEKDSDTCLTYSQPVSKLDISTSFYSNKHSTARFAHLEKRMTETRPQFLEQIPVKISLSQMAQPLKSPKRRVTARVLFGSPVNSPSPKKSTLKTIPEESNRGIPEEGRGISKIGSPTSPSFRSPRRQTFKTPENVRPSQQQKDIPEKLLKARRAILMTPSPSKKTSGASKITSPRSNALKTPSPKKQRTGNTPRKS